jgi:hypothetical protein
MTVKPSAGRSRVQTAAELIQQGLRQLWAEERERADRQRSFRVAPFSEREQAAIRQAELRRIKQEHLMSVNRARFWSFSVEALDAMRELAAEAKKHGQQMRAQGIEARVDEICGRLDQLQKREAGR